MIDIHNVVVSNFHYILFALALVNIIVGLIFNLNQLFIMAILLWVSGLVYDAILRTATQPTDPLKNCDEGNNRG